MDLLFTIVPAIAFAALSCHQRCRKASYRVASINAASRISVTTPAKSRHRGLTQTEGTTVRNARRQIQLGYRADREITRWTWTAAH